MSQQPDPRSKIYYRLFAPYVLILLLGLGGAWWVASQLFSQTLQNRLQDQLSHSVAMLASGSFPLTPQLIRQLSQLIRARIVLLDADGKIRFSTMSYKKAESQKTLLPELQTILKDLSIRTDTVQLDGQQYLLVLQNSSNARDPRVRYIAALASLADIQQTRQRMAMWLWNGALAGLLLLMFIGYRLSRSITQPIQELAAMATKIAHGDRSVRARIHRPDEIGELAESLNEMACRLQNYEQEITRHSRMAALGQMTARIAHEIRNPLTAIKMQLQLLREHANTDDQPLLDSLLDETRRLELIVLSTLQHRKISTPVFKPASLNGIIEDLLRLLQLQFEHQGVQLTRQMDVSLPSMALDKDIITQILLNLLLNARDELPQGGNIMISTGTTEDGQGQYFMIEDNGPGIAENDWSTVFTDAVSHKPGGFGLGLKLCAELAATHHGNIEIAHSKLGGARFIVTLPFVEPRL
jgi:signal transduction histidine kinase